MKLAIIGVTGLVGRVILTLLESREFPVSELIPVASEESLGESIVFNKKQLKIVSIKQALKKTPKLVLFAAGAKISKQWAEKFAQQGSYVIDNSSAWRLTHPLIVPEVNKEVLSKKDRIIANPNCSTIQLVMVLKPLHDLFKIKRVVISTYQSITGTGKKAVEQLHNELLGNTHTKVYPYQIYDNVLPHCDSFEENGYTKEEMKLLNETRKIIGDNKIMLTATAVRVPVQGGHSESVNIEFNKEFSISKVKDLLSKTKGVVVQDDIAKNVYPMPILSREKDQVFVGRIRRDFTQKHSLNLWIVSDNLRKGAATNAIQIAEALLTKKII